MKTCPICTAQAFDDAEVCYGCLHKFTTADHEVQNRHGVHAAKNIGGDLDSGIFSSDNEQNARTHTNTILSPKRPELISLPKISAVVGESASDLNQGVQMKPLSKQPAPVKSYKNSIELPLDSHLALKASCDVILRFFPVACEDGAAGGSGSGPTKV